jgi:D-sedoheptulose 7-phosphate isomerase
MNSQVTKQIKQELQVAIDLKSSIRADDALLAQIVALSECCVTAIRDGAKVIFAGNGGSFADAQHLSAEFTSKFRMERSPMSSLALGTNSSAISAIGNDYGFQYVFSRELEAIGNKNDIFIPITTSGNSTNILNAIEVAKNINITTVCLTGSSGGSAKAMCECICVPSSQTDRIQECHILIGHIICAQVESAIFGTLSRIA